MSQAHAGTVIAFSRAAENHTIEAQSALAPQPRVEVRLMGSFRICVDGEPINLPLSAQRLVALLALEDRSMARHQVAGVLWPDKPEARAAANLRSTLWRLNNCLENIVESDKGFVTLAADVALDIDYLRSAPAPSCVMANASKAAELLVDWYDDWVVIERERVRQQTLRSFENASNELREHGMYPAAIEAGTAAIKLAPLRESAHRTVIDAHLAEGNYAEAVRQYEAFSAILFDSLGVLPSPALGVLFNR